MPGTTVSPKMSTVYVFAVSSSRYKLLGVKSVRNTRFPCSLLSFFIFLLLSGQLCLRFVGEEAGQILNGFFYIPFDCTANAAGQRFVGSVVHSYSGCFLSSFVCLNIKILFATNFHWAVCFSTPAWPWATMPRPLNNATAHKWAIKRYSKFL